MRFNMPLIFLTLVSAGAGLFCVALGLRILASPFLVPLQISFDVLFVTGLIVVGGVIVTMAGLLLLRWSLNCLRDLFSAPVTIKGQVSRRRVVVSGYNAQTPTTAPTTHFVSIGNEEFEVPASDYDMATQGRIVELTYLPNTRTVEAVTPVYPTETVTPVCPSWLTPTVAAVARSIASNHDWRHSTDSG